MASPLINNVSRIQTLASIGLGQRISSFPTLLFGQGLPPMINKIDTVLDIETLTNISGIAPLISRLGGVDKDGKVIMPSTSDVEEYVYALTGEEVSVPAAYKDKRAPGEALYPNATTEEVSMMRMDWALNNVLSKAQRNCIRKINVDSWKTFTTAKMTIKDENNGLKEIDWKRSAVLSNVPVTELWADHATAKPWIDLGNAVKSIRKTGTAVGMYKGISIMGSQSFDDLTEIYRAQRAQEVEPQLFNSYSYKFEGAEMPSEFSFLAGSGLEYGGWVNVSGTNAKVHLFTCDDFYTDESKAVVDMVEADSVTVCLYNAYDYRMYYGPGTKLSGADDEFYKRYFGSRKGMAGTEVLVSDEYADSGVNVNAIEITLWGAEKANGVGGDLEIAYLPALYNPNTVCTLDVKTKA